jgi:hypothetical protein
MPRPRSDKVTTLKELLARRIAAAQPGDRFLSARAVAQRFDVSYQTAHRILAELAHEEALVRRRASGTYVPGETPIKRVAELVFHARARRAGSFGARLLAELTQRFDRERIAWRTRWWSPNGRSSAPMRLGRGGSLPIIWECPTAVDACAAAGLHAILLNDEPAPGLAAVHIDSVSTDDYCGGVCAAELLRRHTGATGGYAVLAGPPGDRRSDRRVAGFGSILKADVEYAGGWYREHGALAAERVLARARSGLFCCNDRLAEAVIEHCQRQGRPCPPLVGFDDAPVAEHLGLTTIAVPWQELIAATVRIAKSRMRGDTAAASHLVIAPRPVLRWARGN